MSLISTGLNVQVDALELYDRTKKKISKLSTTCNRTISKLFQHTLYRDSMRLLFRAFEGSDYTISMPQLHGIDEPYLTQISLDARSQSWLQREVACKAFEDEDLNHDNDQLQQSSNSLLQSVREAFCLQSLGGNHLHQISAAGAQGLASALEQNILDRQLVLSFDLRSAFLDTVCGTGVLGPVAMIPIRLRAKVFAHVQRTFAETNFVRAGRVRISLSRFNNLLREHRCNVASCLVDGDAVRATDVWHKLVVQSAMIIAALAAWDAIMMRGLESSLDRYYPEEMCLAGQECGVHPDLKYNQSSRIEMGVVQFVGRYIATRTTILRACDRYQAVEWSEIDARPERFHKNVPVAERQQATECVDAVPVLWKKVIQLGDVENSRKGPVCLGEKDLVREHKLFATISQHIGDDGDAKIINCEEHVITQTFLYNLLKFEKLDEHLVDGVFSQAKRMRKVIFKSEGCIVCLSKQTRTAVVLFRDDYQESMLGSAMGEIVIGRTPKSKGKALVSEMMALLCASCSDATGEFSSSRFKQVAANERVKSLAQVVRMAKRRIYADLEENLFRTSTISKRLKMVSQHLDEYDLARAERYLVHILAEAAERIYRDTDIGDAYYRCILRKKTLEMTEEDKQRSGLLIDCGVCVTGMASKRSPYVADRMLIQWDHVKWYNEEFMLGHDKLDVRTKIGRDSVLGYRISTDMEPAEDYEGEEHWTIDDHVKATVYVGGLQN